MSNQNEIRLIEHLRVLEELQTGADLDYGTIGKIVVANILRMQRNDLTLQETEPNGRIRLSMQIKVSLRMDAATNGTPSCVCVFDPLNEYPICIGPGCDG